MEGALPMSSLRLLVPPLRLMSAAMWKVVQQRNVKHYEKVEEFVSLVAEAIPHILTDSQMKLLSLALRAKMTLQMLSSAQPQNLEDLKGIRTHFSSLLPSSSQEQIDTGNEALENNFVKLVQRLLEDPKERGHFLKDVSPVAFGPDFDSALEILVCEFFTRLEKILLVPDFKQTAELISDVPSVLDKYKLCVSKGDDLKVLLRDKVHHEKIVESNPSMASSSEQHLFSSLSVLPSLRETSAEQVETNTLPFANPESRESEGTSVLEAKDTVIPDVRRPSEEDSSNAEQTVAGECTESCGDAPNVAEYDGLASAPAQSAPSNTQSPVLSNSMFCPLPQRVAHKCPQCGKCFIYRFELLEHQRLHTGENPFKCTECGKAFRIASSLSSHRRKQCRKAAYLCIRCGNSFQSAKDKLRHQCAARGFNCPQCGKSFKRKLLLDAHVLTHTQNPTFKCKQCGEAFSSITDLRSHQKTHPPSSNQCEQCGKFYSSKSCLRAHEQRHRQQKTQMCAQCGKAFMSKQQLIIHMRTHTGERPYRCSHCGKCFAISGNLNIHIRTHTGEKPYVCSDCGKGFVSGGDLQIHRRTHTGERPNKCEVCGKGFTKASKKTLHMRVHTGERPYVCAECGKAFSSGCELNKHTMTHTGVRPHICHVCAKSYTCLNHLKRHLKTHSETQKESA